MNNLIKKRQASKTYIKEFLCLLVLTNRYWMATKITGEMQHASWYYGIAQYSSSSK